jgi:hypothetical protein
METHIRSTAPSPKFPTAENAKRRANSTNSSHVKQ